MGAGNNDDKLLRLGHLGLIVGPLKEHVEGKCNALGEGLKDKLTDVFGLSQKDVMDGQYDYVNRQGRAAGIPTCTDAMAMNSDQYNFMFTPPNFIIDKNNNPEAFARIERFFFCVNRGILRHVGIKGSDLPRYFEPDLFNVNGNTVVLKRFYDERNETWVKGFISYNKEEIDDDVFDEFFEFRFIPESVNVYSVLARNAVDGHYNKTGGDPSEGVSWKHTPCGFLAEVSMDVIEMFSEAKELVFFNEAAFPVFQNTGSKTRVRVERKEDHGEQMCLIYSPLITGEGEVWELQVTLPVLSNMIDPSGEICGEWIKRGEL